MHLLFVIQRYGLEVAGGSELHCREFATRLGQRGHEVEVLTSCAVSHVEWANFYPPGDTELDGVRVHRLAVHTKDERRYGHVFSRVIWGGAPAPLSLQRRWVELQGPFLPELVPLLAENAVCYDAVIFFTYLFYPTWAGLPVASSQVPTVLHPTAHDEPALALRLYDTTFRHPWSYAFSTTEEAALVRRRFGLCRPSSIIGIGVEIDDKAIDGTEFRAVLGLADRPYLLLLGRFEYLKG